MYQNAATLLQYCQQHNLSLGEAVIRNEMELTETARPVIIEKLKERYDIMKKACTQTLQNPIPSISGLTCGQAHLTYQQINKNSLCGHLQLKAVAYALSCFEVNASMGKIVAAPTAGACGILPGCLLAVGEEKNKTEEELLSALATASGIGRIIAIHATLAGAQGGCQAECGSAAAMAAGALVQLQNGTPQMSFIAAGIALENIMGLVCDPVAGLVEIPCAKRNAGGVANAFLAADMALSGITNVIPFDEIVDAMSKVGKALPKSLKETSLGGLAATPTAIKIQKELFGSID